MNATLQHHIRKYEASDPEFVKLMLNSFYCDDLCTSVNTVQEAVDVCMSNRIYKEGHFNLRKWNSNSKEVMKELTSYGDNVKKADPVITKTLEQGDESFLKLSFGKFDELERKIEQKILGLNLNTESDVLSLKFGNIVECGKGWSLRKHQS